MKKIMVRPRLKKTFFRRFNRDNQIVFLNYTVWRRGWFFERIVNNITKIRLVYDGWSHSWEQITWHEQQMHTLGNNKSTVQDPISFWQIVHRIYELGGGTYDKRCKECLALSGYPVEVLQAGRAKHSKCRSNPLNILEPTPQASHQNMDTLISNLREPSIRGWKTAKLLKGGGWICNRCTWRIYYCCRKWEYALGDVGAWLKK